MMVSKRPRARMLRAVAAAAVLASFLVPLRVAAQEEKPAATGRNAKVQLFGVGWVTYRYKLAEEPARTAPFSSVGVTGESFGKDSNSFDLDRVYVGAEYAFSDRYSWQTILEASNPGGKLDLFLKRAFLRIKAPFGLTGTAVRMGQIGHVFIGNVEDVWGYRIVSKVPVDRYLGISTTWAGLGVEGQVLHGYLDFDAAVANERAYNQPGPVVNNVATPNRDKYKSVMGRLTFTPMPSDDLLKGLKVSVFGQFGAKVPGTASIKPDASKNNTRWYGVFPYFKAARYAAGLEYTVKFDRSGTVDGSYRDVGSVYAGGFAEADVTTRDRVFLRLDHYDPDHHVDDNAMLILMGGFSHSYMKGVRSLVDVEYDKYQEPANTSFDPDVTVSGRLEVTL
jgi:hypothetical protein